MQSRHIGFIGRVYVEDSNFLDHPGPRLVEGLELPARLIHPALFKDMP